MLPPGKPHVAEIISNCYSYLKKKESYWAITFQQTEERQICLLYFIRRKTSSCMYTVPLIKLSFCFSNQVKWDTLSMDFIYGSNTTIPWTLQKDVWVCAIGFLIFNLETLVIPQVIAELKLSIEIFSMVIVAENILVTDAHSLWQR